jgi:signal transduction histidine kinase
MVSADQWALRRILENKIADAISYTAPGGLVEIAVVREQGWHVVEIVTSGSWPPGALEAAANPDRAMLMPAAMGLALSHRLARTMGASLVFTGGAGEATTIRLRLPTTEKV